MVRERIQLQAQWLKGECSCPSAPARWKWCVALVIGVFAGTACGVGDGMVPSTVQDPEKVKNANGAMGLYREARAGFSAAVDEATLFGGLLTDELATLPGTPPGPLGNNLPKYSPVDSRQDLSMVSPRRLHQLRAQASEARGFLALFASDSPPALRSHLYSIQGYAEIFLADLFCSGIPLSTVDFDGNYTFAAGSTTEEVYQHAVALFDTALTLADDSLNMQRLATMGRGRALLALGRYTDAASTVATVPSDYRYLVEVAWNGSVQPFLASSGTIPDTMALMWYWTRPAASTADNNAKRRGAPSVGEQEGLNGLNYRTSGDVRIQAIAKGSTPEGHILYMPAKYTRDGTTVASPVAFTLASGIEARLIEAEAALQVNSGEWLTKLNALRQTVGLADTTDPGASLDPAAATTARVNLLFRERAFWLYLTGQRQGDLRRLIRQYGRAPETVYPWGSYLGLDTYGLAIVVPMPDSEILLNPNYTGCKHPNA